MDNRLEKYSKLIIKTGLNLQRGQRLIISAPVEAAPFARLCTSAAYDAGCSEVVLRWTDEYITREKYLKGADLIFDEMPEWQKHFYNDYSEEGAAFLSIYAADPEALKGVDPNRLRRVNIASGKALEAYRQRQMENLFQWCIVSIPTEAWAKKVFPEPQGESAVDLLWEEIFNCSRVYADSDPVELWQKHIETLSLKKNKLTELNFKMLHYVNSAGTDLMVGLPENHVWEGGSEITKGGLPFCANMPTEEVFTAPKKYDVNGAVVATKPLVLGGNIVEGLKFELKDGKIVKVTAEKGVEFVEQELKVDEGASFLGEVALVPYNSPISNSGILFYNTLFDENASCHFAFGKAYPCIKDAAEMSKEEQSEAGLNDSITHVDFMIGSSDLSITGITKSGEKVPVFVNGNFAI
jgi:aminopeptidase